MSYHIRTKEDYDKNYLHSVERKNQFWEEIAKEFTWFQTWDKLILDLIENNTSSETTRKATVM